jgi:hypothetical protein
MSFIKLESKIFTFFLRCVAISCCVSDRIGSECMKMEGKAIVWETIRENAVGDIWGRKTQDNKVISNESHNQIARSPTSVIVVKLSVYSLSYRHSWKIIYSQVYSLFSFKLYGKLFTGHLFEQSHGRTNCDTSDYNPIHFDLHCLSCTGCSITLTSCSSSLVSNHLIPRSNFINHPKYVVPNLRRLSPDQPKALISTYDAADVFKSLNSHEQ